MPILSYTPLIKMTYFHPAFPTALSTGFAVKIITDFVNTKSINIKQAVNFGLFLEAIRIVKRTLGSSFVAGFLSLYCFRQLSRSTVIYLLTRALFSRVYIRMPQVYVFVGIQIILGYFGNYYPEYMEPSYSKFLARITSVNLMDFPTLVKQNYASCVNYHPSTSCIKGTFHFIPKNMLSILKTYAVAHAIPHLLKFNMKTSFRMYLISVSRSTLFLTSYVTIARAVPCLSRYLIGGHNTVLTVGVWMMCGFLILIEKRSRRYEFVLYCLAKAIDMIINKVMNDSCPNKTGKQSISWENFIESVLFGSALYMWSQAVQNKCSHMRKMDRFIGSYV